MIIPCYLHSIDIFASFTGCEDDIFPVLSNLHDEVKKMAENWTNLLENLRGKIEFCRTRRTGRTRFFATLSHSYCYSAEF